MCNTRAESDSHGVSSRLEVGERRRAQQRVPPEDEKASESESGRGHDLVNDPGGEGRRKDGF